MKKQTSAPPSWMILDCDVDEAIREIAAIGIPVIAPYTPPFSIVVDKNEGFPYRFSGMVADGANAGRPIVVNTVSKALYLMGRRQIEVKGNLFQKGLADYSIDGLEELIQIERKSLEDLYGTLGGRRDDFEAEIARLNLCDFAAVVVEASWDDILNNPPDHSRLLPKTVRQTIVSWSMRYRHVHWFTCSGRDDAENLTYRLLEMFWRHREHENKPG